jgi:hypothetical protein
MAKDNPNTRPKKPKEPTPFQKFERFAKKIVRVQKREIEGLKKKSQDQSPRSSESS